MVSTRAKSPAKKTPAKSKKAASKAKPAPSMVSAQTAIKVVSWYGMVFFIGLAIFTDKMAESYQVGTTGKSQSFMKFAGLNGMMAVWLTNAFVARVAHKKTMSLTCFANMIAFGMIGVWQFAHSPIIAGDISFSSKIGMPAMMEYANVAQQVTLFVLSFMGWKESGSSTMSLPSFKKVSELNKVNYATIGVCLFFGIMTTCFSPTILEMYLPGNVWANTAEQAMCAELMKFMGMLLLGNAIRMEAVIQGGDEDCAYSGVRANSYYYAFALGMSIMNDANGISNMGQTMEKLMFAKVIDFVRNGGIFVWSYQTLIKYE